MSSLFRFKQFSVDQAGAAMKVGFDGVLLGAWASPLQGTPAPLRCLDIGAGTGLLALMLAQRFVHARVDAIEVEAAAAQQAAANFATSPWHDRLTIYHTDFFDFVAHCPVASFDLIVCNPPFFQNALLPNDIARRLARHADSLPYERLLRGVAQLIAPRGSAAFVLPFDAHRSFLQLAANAQLYCHRRVDVQSRPNTLPKRVLISLSQIPNDTPPHHTLITGDGQQWAYTEEYKSLTQDFYLKF